MIYYLCPDDDDPCGGIKQIYRHVDVLNNIGFKARVLHEDADFRCTWFDNETLTAGEKALAGITPADVLVVPEIYGPKLYNFAPGVPKVVFNQNAYYTFIDYALEGEAPAYLHPEIVATLCVSEDNGKYLEYALPYTVVLRVKYGIDKPFEYSPDKERLVSFMPRKNRRDVVQVINILRSRGLVNDWTFEQIDGVTEEESAAVMKRSAVYLAFGGPEGCGMPPMEAMKCGCFIIGYSGGGGHEYFRKEHSIEITQGDVQGLSQAVEYALRNRSFDAIREAGSHASRYITYHYSIEEEVRTVGEAWLRISALLRNRK